MGLFSKAGNKDEGENIVVCADVLDIAHATEFHQALKNALGKGGVVVLDGAGIERIDAAALQLCVAFFHEAMARKVQAKWLTPSEPLIRAAGLLGLKDQLGLPGGN